LPSLSFLSFLGDIYRIGGYEFDYWERKYRWLNELGIAGGKGIETLEEKGGRGEEETTVMIKESDPALMFAPRRVDLEEKRQAELHDLMSDDDEDDDDELYDDDDDDDSEEEEAQEGKTEKKKALKKCKTIKKADDVQTMEERYPNGFVVDVINFD
jgi:hypothetical protein